MDTPNNTYTPEYLQYLERRYNDLKQLIGAVCFRYDDEELKENYAFEIMTREFNYLANELNFDNLPAFLDKNADVDAAFIIRLADEIELTESDD